jgi:hypothetical protein
MHAAYRSLCSKNKVVLQGRGRLGGRAGAPQRLHFLLHGNFSALKKCEGKRWTVTYIPHYSVHLGSLLHSLCKTLHIRIEQAAGRVQRAHSSSRSPAREA